MISVVFSSILFLFYGKTGGFLNFSVSRETCGGWQNQTHDLSVMNWLLEPLDHHLGPELFYLEDL